MNLSQLSGDEKLFLSRLGDLFNISRDKYKTRFSHFLSERQASIALEFAKQNKFDNFLLYGGRENAVRLVLGAFALHDAVSPEAFPITHITARYPEQAPLNHRDFLGSLMALRISRESIGDILVSPGRCDFFALEPVSGTILSELKKVGSFGVKTSLGVPGDFIVLERFEEVRAVIASVRIDCLVAALTNLSREKAARLISEGLVQRNYSEADNCSRPFLEGDIFSIRGYGKYIADEILPPTKKGKLPVLCRKYI